MTRRDAVNRLTARLVPLYGEREARAIARNAVAELAGIPLSALLTDPGAEFAAERSEEAAESRCNTSSDTPNFTGAASPCAREC